MMDRDDDDDDDDDEDEDGDRMKAQVWLTSTTPTRAVGTCILRTLCTDKGGSQEVISGLWPRNRKLIKTHSDLDFGISNSSNIYHIFLVLPIYHPQINITTDTDVFFLLAPRNSQSDRLCVEGFWILCVRCRKWVGKGVGCLWFVQFFRLLNFFCQQNCRRWKKILLMDNILHFSQLV